MDNLPLIYSSPASTKTADDDQLPIKSMGPLAHQKITAPLMLSEVGPKGDHPLNTRVRPCPTPRTNTRNISQCLTATVPKYSLFLARFVNRRQIEEKSKPSLGQSHQRHWVSDFHYTTQKGRVKILTRSVYMLDNACACSIL